MKSSRGSEFNSQQLRSGSPSVRGSALFWPVSVCAAEQAYSEKEVDNHLWNLVILSEKEKKNVWNGSDHRVDNQ